MALGDVIARLSVVLGLETAAFEEGANIAEKRAAQFGKKLEKIGTNITKFGAIATAGLTLPLVAFGKQAFQAATDAAELDAAFGETFGNLTGQMHTWAEATGNAMGRSTREIKEGANTFGLYFNQVAKSREEAAKMSQTFSVLAQDLASFHNTDVETAILSLRSGLSGEAEPMRKFGVFLSEAAVNAKAAEMGIAALGTKLTDEEKIAARYAIIMEKTASAQGDVMRTSDSTANQIRRSKAAWEEIQITVGTKLLPALTPLIETLGRVLDKFNQLSPTAQTWVVGIGAAAAAIGPLMLGLGPLLIAVGKLAPLFVGLIPVIGTFAKALIGLAIAGGPITIAILAAGALYLAFKNWDKISAIVQRVYSAVKTWLVDKFNGIVKSVSEKVDSVIGFFRNMWDRVVGNSYVPDMVAAIGEHMARLDALMVQPVKDATSKTEQAFRDLQQSAHALFSRLFPEQAAGNQFLADIKTLRDYAAQAQLPVGQLDEALRRLRNEHFGESGEPSFMNDNISLVKDTTTDFSKISDALVEKAEMTKDAIIRAYGEMAAGVVHNLRGLVDQIKKGDILGALETILATVSGVVDTLVRVGVIKTPAASPPPRYAGGTNFHPGGLAIVGERGPELVNLPRGSQVLSNRESFGERQRIEIVPSAYFDVVVDGRAARVAAPMAGQAAMAGAAGGMVGVARQRVRQIP